MDLVFLIPITFLVAVTFIVKWTLEHARWKRQQDQADPLNGNSVSVSELHAMIHDAVAEAAQPLSERVAALEQHAAAEQLPPARAGLLDEVDAYTSEAALNAPLRQPVR